MGQYLWFSVSQRTVHLYIKWNFIHSYEILIEYFIIYSLILKNGETEGYFSIISIIYLCFPSPRPVLMPLTDAGFHCRSCRKQLRMVVTHNASVWLGLTACTLFAYLGSQPQIHPLGRTLLMILSSIPIILSLHPACFPPSI